MRRPPSPAVHDDPRSRGTAAESLAADFLTGRGLAVVARNVRCKGGEIDLICRDGEMLILVEVRQRTSRQFGGALASVTTGKQRKLLRAARFALQRHPEWRHRRIRFDVVGIQGSPYDTHGIQWIQGAFEGW
jgi:putative endonuclease